MNGRLPGDRFFNSPCYTDLTRRNEAAAQQQKVRHDMKKGLTELVMILDRSGSMSGLEADTIGGFNSLIDKQKKEEGEAYVSVVLFDDRSEVLYDRVDIRKIEPMNDKQYYVRGCTALLDAVGGAIHHISTVHKYARMPGKKMCRRRLSLSSQRMVWRMPAISIPMRRCAA